MAEAAPILTQRTNFYVIVGSSAGALTGLQFVVIALIAEARAASSMLVLRAFASPTVVHFCAALLVSAILAAPWSSVSSAAICVAVTGGAGVIYALLVVRHARRQQGYSPDAEDWFWYVMLPLATYATMFAAGVTLAWHSGALFVIAATTLSLLFNGIHNAWDTVTYVGVVQRIKRQEAEKRSGS